MLLNITKKLITATALISCTTAASADIAKCNLVAEAFNGDYAPVSENILSADLFFEIPPLSQIVNDPNQTIGKDLGNGSQVAISLMNGQLIMEHIKVYIDFLGKTVKQGSAYKCEYITISTF